MLTMKLLEASGIKLKLVSENSYDKPKLQTTKTGLFYLQGQKGREYMIIATTKRRSRKTCVIGPPFPQGAQNN